MIDFKVWAQVEEVRGDGAETCRDWVDLGVHCAIFLKAYELTRGVMA